MGGKRKRKSAKEADPEPFTVRMAHFSVTTVAFLLILYVAAFFVIRTDGFTSYVEEWLAEKGGMEVDIGSVRASPALNLVLNQVRIHSKDDAAGVEIAQVSVRWSFAGLVSRDLPTVSEIVVDDCRIVFTRGFDGRWEPAGLGAACRVISEWGRIDSHLQSQPNTSSAANTNPSKKEAAEHHEVSEPALDHDGVDIRLRHAQIIWMNASGDTLASMEGVRADITHLATPRKSFTHYDLSADRVVTSSGQESKVAMEYLRSGESDTLLSYQHVPLRRGVLASVQESRSRALKEVDRTAPDTQSSPSVQADDGVLRTVAPSEYDEIKESFERALLAE